MPYPQTPYFTGPVVSNIAATERYRPFSRVSLYPDMPSSDFTITITPDKRENGRLLIPDNLRQNFKSVSYNPDDGSCTLVVALTGYPGYSTAVQDALGNVEFIPNANLISSGQYLLTNFTIGVAYIAHGFYLNVLFYNVDEYVTEQFAVYAYAGATVSGDSNAALVIGTPGNDTLSSANAHPFFYGNGGIDTIALSAGRETVYLNKLGIYGAWTEGQGIDVVTGFQSGIDSLAVDMTAFGITPGSFRFVSGPNAGPVAALPTFSYDTSNGYLWFDADGTGANTANLIAYLPGAPALAASDLIPSRVYFSGDPAFGPSTAVNQTPGSTAYGEGPSLTMWATGDNETLVGGPYRGQYIAKGKNDTIIAGDGGSFIAGLGGYDSLLGGAGADTFYFASRTAGVDTIWNFNVSQGDNIVVQGSGFAAPSGFHFTDGVGFVQGANAAAVAQTATFIYDTSSGYLWFDPDGTGAGSTRSLVAFLPGVPTLQAADFSVA